MESFYFGIEDNIKMEYEKETKSMKLSLGNLTTAGWYWSGDEKDLLGFLIRCKNSELQKEFLEEARKYFTFSEIKPFLLKSLGAKSGLYEISGDNSLWHFGSIDDYFDNFGKDDTEEWLKTEYPKLTDKQIDEFFENMVSQDSFSIDYDEFEKEYFSSYKKEMSEIIKESERIEEFFMAVENLETTVKYEWVTDYEDNKIADSISYALKDYLKIPKSVVDDPNQKKLKAE